MRTSGSSAIVAKLLSALTGHGWTAFISLDPVLALGALLELCPLDEFEEILIIFIETIAYLILFACHPHMEIASASQTVMFLACGTAIVV